MIILKMNEMLFIPKHIFEKLYEKHYKKRPVTFNTNMTPSGSVPTLYNKKRTKIYVPYVANTNFYSQLQGLEKLFGKPLFHSGTNI